MDNASRHERLTEVFVTASSMPPEKRRAYLLEACAGDAELRAEVEALLASDADAEGDFLQLPSIAGDAAERAADDDAERPETIGPYRVLGVLGSGGMGVVYHAEQTEPVDRQIAIKIIKLGMDTKQVLARFDAERQALAMMDHPNVARLYDASATSEGRPFFVMEYVPGTPITEYCDRHRLKLDERLDLFTQVCDAIQHAHQKGVIHRDLKPSNVLVTVREGRPLAKVIDFGVAKAVGKRLTERTLHTEQGELIGTPEYMSPEQAELTAEDVDTRTDVYSLGILLYELLTGTLPYDRATLRRAGLAEIHRLICESEPQKPSTRLSRFDDDPATFAALRSTDIRSLVQDLRGDLDWIVMKALEKDRTRRYATASELAADVARHVRHEPVMAGPPSASYRLQKFIRRNRAGVAAAFIAAASLLVAAGVSLGFAVSEAEQRRLAATERDIATAVNDFLTQDLLAAVAPSTEAGKGRDVPMREVLDAAGRRIEEAVRPGGRFHDLPLVEASIRETLGVTYRQLAHYDTAEHHLRRALELWRDERGETNAATLSVMNELGDLCAVQARYDEAETLYTTAYEAARQTLGDDHLVTIRCIDDLGSLRQRQGRLADAEPLHKDAVRLARANFGPDHAMTVNATGNLVRIYRSLGRLKDAEHAAVDALSAQPGGVDAIRPETLSLSAALGSLYRELARLEDAERICKGTIEVATDMFGEDHPDTLSCMNSLALVYNDQDRYDEAEAIHLRVLELRRGRFDENHPAMIETLTNLVILYANQERYDEAIPMAEELVEVSAEALGRDHHNTLFAIMNLSQLYVDQGQLEDSLRLRREAVASARRVFPAESWLLAAFTGELGKTLADLERYDEAEAVLLEAFEGLQKSLGLEHDRTTRITEALVTMYEAQGMSETAEEWRGKLPVAQESLTSD